MAFWACEGAISVGSCNICGDEPVCAVLKFAFFVFFCDFLFFPRRFEHGRFSCKGGRDMAGKIPTTSAISCSMPTALCASQPSLLSCSLLPSFVLHFSQFSHSFSNFPSFHPFPSSLLFFSVIFQYFSFTFSHFPLFQCFFGQSDASPCDLLVSNVPHEAQDDETNATCCERGFCMFLGIFRHIQKKGPN